MFVFTLAVYYFEIPENCEDARPAGKARGRIPQKIIDLGPDFLGVTNVVENPETWDE